MFDYENLVEMFERSVQKFGDRPMYGQKIDGKYEWLTFREVATRVDACRAGLAKIGVKANHRIACIANNRIEWFVTAYACLGLGAAWVPMYEAQLERDWEFILRDSGSSILFVSSHLIYERVKHLPETVPTLHKIVVFDRCDDVELTYEQLQKMGEGSQVPSIAPSPDTIASFIYTSGTTADPKGVLLSHKNFTANISGMHQVFEVFPEDRTLSFLPWAHCFGQTIEVHTLYSYGASVALAESIEKLLENMIEARPTILLTVPRVFHKLYDKVQSSLENQPAPIRALVRSALAASKKKRAGMRLSIFEVASQKLADAIVFSKVRARFGGRVRFAISGGAAMAIEVAEFIESVGIKVYEGYGMTETSPVISAGPLGASKMGTVGKPLPNVRVVIDKSITDDPVEGEIVVYGDSVMAGYHDRSAETEASFTADGGFRTGDLGHLDDDGFLLLTGRIKEQYKLENGKYVLPSQIEEKLKLSRYLLNAMVYGSNRPFNVALLCANMPEIRAWAKVHHVRANDDESLLAHGAIRHLIQKEIDTLTEDFKQFERIGAFALLAEDFSVQNGLLTPKLSLKRRSVLERYRTQLDAMYPARRSAFPPSE